MVNTRSKKNPVIFEPLAHPILNSVDPAEAVKFKRERERYELEVSHRDKDGSPMEPASYQVSVEPQTLRSTVGFGYFDEIAPDVEAKDLSDENIKKCIDDMAKAHDADEPDSNRIYAALSTLKMNVKITDSKARVFQLAVDFERRLEEAGYGEFRATNTKKAVKLLAERLHPAALKAQIEDDFEFVPKLKKDWKFFLKYVAKQAEHIEKGTGSLRRAGGRAPGGLQSGESGSTTKDKGKPKTPNTKDIQNNTGENPGTSKDKSDSSPKTRELPKCLNEGCPERHYLSQCGNTPENQKPGLIKKWRDQKGKSRLVQDAGSPKDVSMIKATFAKVIEREVCADLGSDINLMPPDVLAGLVSKGALMSVRMFDTTRKYKLAVEQDVDGKDIFVECDRRVTLTTELHVRHGNLLSLRNLTWYVSTKAASDLLLSKHLLHALGLDAKKTLAAACDKYNGIVDVTELLGDEDYATGSLAHIISEAGVFHSDGAAADDADDNDSAYLELGIDTEEEIQCAFCSLVETAKENGLSEKGQEQLAGMLQEHRDVFRIRLGSDLPAKVEPMKLQLKMDATPVIAKARRYNAEQRTYLSKFVTRAEKFGFIRKSPDATWTAAPLLLAKNQPNKYRVTFDFRPVNTATVPTVWPMPHIDSECSDFAGSTVFASIDFCSGYWQLPLAESAQDAHSFITPQGIYSSTRTQQGGTNASMNFQSRVEPCFSELRQFLKGWQDDFIAHHPTETGLLDVLKRFFHICRQVGLKISAKKSTLFTHSVKWCGRIIDQDGVTFDPRRLSGLKRVFMPETAGELSQYCHCLQWMANSIQDFANRVSPLRDVLEEAYTQTGRRTTKSIKSISLANLSWGPRHEEAFTSLQDSLRESVKLAHLDPEKEVCVYTDASDTYWAAVVTQCEKEDLDKEVENQRHNPLAFLSTEFADSELKWSTIEKEAFAIYQVFKKLDYLFLTSKASHVFTDHRNLLFVFNPLALESALGRHIVSKVQRWALYLSRFQYTIEHIAGERNVMADIMTRWFSGYRKKNFTARVTRVSVIQLSEDMVPSPFAAGFEWPSTESIKQYQEHSSSEAPKHALVDTDGIVRVDGKLWIPSDEPDLQLRLLIVSHCGTRGHRGATATASTLREELFWDSLKEDCKQFIRFCIHCITSRGGGKIPRPRGTQFVATKPNEVIHFDFLYMGNGTDGLKYTLILRDGLSSYVWLWPAMAANAETAAKALSRWIDVFTLMGFWVSDQGSHFKNRVMQELAEEHKLHHHFVTAYSPWANGSVERCCREVLHACRALLSELRLAPQDWPSVVNIIQTVLNEAPLERLGKRTDGTLRTPLEVMNGLQPCRSTLSTNREFGDSTKTLENAKVMQLMSIDSLQGAVEGLHRDVAERVTKNRQRQMALHNRKTNIVKPQFELEDFVLVRRAHDKGHKLSFKWQGPKRITKLLNTLVYEVTGLLDDKTETVHAVRLMLYRAGEEGKEVSDELLAHASHTEAQYEDIHEMMDIREDGAGFCVRVSWEGLPDDRDYTWEAIETLDEDVPELLEEVFSRTSKMSLAKRARARLDRATLNK